MDSAATSLQFLSSITYAKEIKEKLSQSLEKVELLKSQLQKAEALKRFLIARKNEWKTQLAKFGLAKNFKKLSKTVYYYQQQLAEYKNILNDPRKIERKALELLSKTKPWKDFFKKHSQLASLFRLPGSEGDPDYMASLAGLQTRAQVNGIIQAQLSNGGAAARDQLRQNLQAAQAQMNQLKDKILKFGSGSSDAAMPEGFKPNNQKTKTFWQRLEYGANMQSQKATNFFPVTSDLGLSVGYKLNDKSIIGIGASYKIGLGRGWNDIHFSSEGLGLRSYIDWKIKGGLWISGGYEQNLKTGFQDLSDLRTKNIWQQSGLLGLSKKLSIKTKFFKQTNIKLLWDFMSYRQIPRTQPVVVRVGYNF